MSYSVQTVLTDVASAIHGTTVNKVPNIYGLLNRAARDVILDIDPKETQKIVQLSQVFNDVYDYPIPVDVKGDREIDLRPQAGRNPWDIFTQGYAQSFDANKGVSFDNKIYTQWNTGVKSLRIEAPTLTSPTTLCDTSTILGWAATTGASTVTLDSTNNVAGGGALVLNLLAGSSTGYIENSTLNAVDLSAQVNISTLFMWVYLPMASAITSVNLRWGSSSSNYYNYTATVAQQGTSFQNGYNLLAFPWVSATKVGTPINTAYNYSRVTFNYNSTLQTGLKVDNITSNLGYIFELQYYSKYLFRDPSTNAFQETVVDATDNNKLVNLDTDSYNIYFNKVMWYVAQSLQGADAEYDANFYGGEDGQGGAYGASIKKYKALNPAESMMKAEVYYSPNRKNYSRYFNGGYNPR